MVTIETHEGHYFYGNLLTITVDSIFIADKELQILSFNKKDIKKFQTGIITPHFNYTPNSSVPYYVQSAIPNGSGNHYYKNYYIFGNEFNFGLTDNLNLAVGFETVSLIFNTGNAFPIIQLGTKYSAEMAEKVHIGFSAKYYFNDEISALMLGIPFTIGSKRTNLTISPTYLRGDGSGNIGVFANFSLALNSKSRLVFDYIRVNDSGISAIVFEHLFKNRFSLSVGAIVTSDGSVPNLSFSIPFG